MDRSGTTTEPLAATCYGVAVLLMRSNQCVQEIWASKSVHEAEIKSAEYVQVISWLLLENSMGIFFIIIRAILCNQQAALENDTSP